MAKIGLKLDFDGLLDAIKAAGGDVDKAAMQAAKECASVVHNELVSECNASGISASVSGAVKHGVTRTGNRYEIEAGWKMGEYDPKNPSAGYKAVFLNYGTPKPRHTKKKYHVPVHGEWATTTNRGQIVGRGFIGRAKDGAKPKVKKVQKEALKKMLKELM